MNSYLIGKRPVGTFAYIAKNIIDEPFGFAFAQLVAASHEYFLQPGTYVHLDRSLGSGQIQARNELVQKFQGDWLLQLDSDHTFDPDLAFRMLQLFEANRLDVLVAPYVYKEMPHNPVIYQYVAGEKDPYKNMVSWGTPEMTVRLLPIGAAGAGCLLVRRGVFDRIRSEQGAEPFSPFGKFFTDDFSFFERCRVLGIKCWAAMTVECRHLRMSSVGMDDFDQSYAPGNATQNVAGMA